ncbi:MAG: hypothetical protein K6G71_07415 [Clostridiales bacterium]|nr:hypothetical protein [Clostridiales bacterium]
MSERRTHTSTEVKRRYNEKVCTVISFSAPKELAAEFKERCAAVGISQASVLKEAMRRFLDDNPAQ